MLNEKCHVCGKTHKTWNMIIKCFRKNLDKVDWNWVSRYQILSEEFIREFQDKVNWDRISVHQILSEEFIREFQDKVIWDQISSYQNLSEGFIREFQDKVHWDRISEYQISYRERTFNPTNLQDYAEKHHLEIKDGYLYAFRNHDKRGRGYFNYNKSYQTGTYYEDWHIDLNPNHKNSYGFGIWPEGNTPIRVKLEDWGTEVKKDSQGKARVRGFEII